MFIISLFITPKTAPSGAKSTWEKYGAFLNSFHLEVKSLIQRYERINHKISRNEVSVLSDQTCACMHVCIYTLDVCVYSNTYICMYIHTHFYIYTYFYPQIHTHLYTCQHVHTFILYQHAHTHTYF